jgi:hypothetical protein
MKRISFVCSVATAILLASCNSDSKEHSDMSEKDSLAARPPVDTVGKNPPVVTPEVEKPSLEKIVNNTLWVEVIPKSEGMVSYIGGTITNLSEDVTFKNPVLAFSIITFDGLHTYTKQRIGTDFRLDTIIPPKSSVKFMTSFFVITEDKFLEGIKSNTKKSYSAEIKKVKRIK